MLRDSGSTPEQLIRMVSSPGGTTLKALDVFDAPFAPLIMAEVEFGSKEAAEAFVPPAWFDKDVTYCKEYHNSYLALELHHAPENS